MYKEWWQKHLGQKLIINVFDNQGVICLKISIPIYTGNLYLGIDNIVYNRYALKCNVIMLLFLNFIYTYI